MGVQPEFPTVVKFGRPATIAAEPMPVTFDLERTALISSSTCSAIFSNRWVR